MNRDILVPLVAKPREIRCSHFNILKLKGQTQWGEGVSSKGGESPLSLVWSAGQVDAEKDHRCSYDHEDSNRLTQSEPGKDSGNDRREVGVDGRSCAANLAHPRVPNDVGQGDGHASREEQTQPALPGDCGPILGQQLGDGEKHDERRPGGHGQGCQL